jgi:DNA-directed RNA polymerase III subunit RPC4
MFQFPNLFPRFEDPKPVDATEETPATNGEAANGNAKDVKPDVKPDIKPTPLQLRGNAKKHGVKPPEGRIGSLVVMKSGRVKMVLGDGIVMNVCPCPFPCIKCGADEKVSPGVETTFLQQLVHLDNKSKAAVVLGEINKNYVVTPDIDRLLQDLFINGGMTPGDKEWEEHKQKFRRARAEGGPGLMKMEMD